MEASGKTTPRTYRISDALPASAQDVFRCSFLRFSDGFPGSLRILSGDSPKTAGRMARVSRAARALHSPSLRVCKPRSEPLRRTLVLRREASVAPGMQEQRGRGDFQSPCIRATRRTLGAQESAPTGDPPLHEADRAPGRNHWASADCARSEGSSAACAACTAP